ncbi:GDSL family lipase [Pseudomonas sp. ODNR1LW]|nr:GDSL family lipase [Pseudomonas sp. ODNR1LW]
MAAFVLAMFDTAHAEPLQVSWVGESAAPGETLPLKVGGRVQFADGRYVSQWPGTYFETVFRESSAFFQVGPGDVRLRVTVDGQSVAVTRPREGLHRIDGLGEGDHRLRIDVVSENQAAPVRFGGVFGTPAQSLAVERRDRQIEFVGDSHTVGYANTSNERTCSADEVWATTDTAAGIAGLLAARYDADYQVNAISGRGVVRNYDGMPRDTLPQAYPFVLFDKQSTYSGADWRPQVVVVALGTNDFSTALKPGEPWSDREALTADYETAYAAFLRGLRSRSPQAWMIVWGAEGSEMASASGRVVDRLKSEGFENLIFVPVPGLTLAACDWHPDLADDRVVASAIEAVLDSEASPWRGR